MHPEIRPENSIFVIFRRILMKLTHVMYDYKVLSSFGIWLTWLYILLTWLPTWLPWQPIFKNNRYFGDTPSLQISRHSDDF